MKYSLILLIILTLLLSTGCFTTNKYSRGSLSEGMEKARDDYPDERTVPSEEKPEWEQRDDWWFENDSDSSQENQNNRNEDDSSENVEADYEDVGPLHIGIRGGTALVSGPYFDTKFDAEVFLGGGEENIAFYFYGGLTAVTAKDDHEIRESIEDGVIILRVGIEGRYYPFPQWQVFSPYGLAQGGLIYMYWSFKNPLDAGIETITGDSIGGIHIATGLGMDLIHHKSFRFGASCIPEIYIFGSETQEGFTNDVFDAFGSVRWALEAVIVTE